MAGRFGVNFRPRPKSGMRGIPVCHGCEVEPSSCPQKPIYKHAFLLSWLRVNTPSDYPMHARFLPTVIQEFEALGRRLGCVNKPHFETAMQELRAEKNKIT